MRRFSGDGRLDRLGYLFALLAAGVLFCAPAVLLAPGGLADHADEAHRGLVRAAGSAAGVVCWLLVLWVYCAATARRLHDLGRTGWLTLLALAPVVGLGALTVVLLAAPGAAGENRYGPPGL